MFRCPAKIHERHLCIRQKKNSVWLIHIVARLFFKIGCLILLYDWHETLEWTGYHSICNYTMSHLYHQNQKKQYIYICCTITQRSHQHPPSFSSICMPKYFYDLFRTTTLPKQLHPHPPPPPMPLKIFITKILTCALFVLHYAG